MYGMTFQFSLLILSFIICSNNPSDNSFYEASYLCLNVELVGLGKRCLTSDLFMLIVKCLVMEKGVITGPWEVAVVTSTS